jgi:hypothetical protein
VPDGIFVAKDQRSVLSARRWTLSAQRSAMVQPWRHHGCKRALRITYISSRLIANAVIIAGKWMDGRAYLHYGYAMAAPQLQM